MAFSFRLMLSTERLKLEKRNEQLFSLHLMNTNTLRLLSHLLCCRFIHLIQETNTGDMVLLCLSPHSQCLRLLEDSKQHKQVSSEHALIEKNNASMKRVACKL